MFFLLTYSSTVRLSHRLSILNVDKADGLRPIPGRYRVSTRFLNNSTVDILDQVSGRCSSTQCRMFSSIPGLYPLHAISTLQLWLSKLPPDIINCLLGVGGKIFSPLRTAGLVVYITCNQNHCRHSFVCFVVIFNEVWENPIWSKSVVLGYESLSQSCDGFSFKCQITYTGLRVSFNGLCVRERVLRFCIDVYFILFIYLLVSLLQWSSERQTNLAYCYWLN